MELMTLDEYTKLAVRLMNYAKVKPSLITDDNIGLVVRYLVNSDMKYDQNKSSLRTYRYHGFKHALSKIFEKPKNSTISLDDMVDSQSRYELVSSNDKTPLELFELQEDETNGTTRLLELVNHPVLTPKEKEYLHLTYVEGLNQREITERLNVSKQAVSESLIRAIRKLKEVCVKH